MFQTDTHPSASGAPVPDDAVSRLYSVSRDLYAPVLTAFAVRCLDHLRVQPQSVNMCLARDGVSPFLAQHVLLRMAPDRFTRIAPQRVQLAYLSRQLVREGRASLVTKTLVGRYLWRGSVPSSALMTLIDIGIHGSIQDDLSKWYPNLAIFGQYLLYRRRSSDHLAMRKSGFLVGDPVGMDDAWFLQRNVIHLLEDLWSGVYESVTRLQPVGAPTPQRSGRATRSIPRHPQVRPVLDLLGTHSRLPLSADQIYQLKRTALRGVVDGVARTVRSSANELFADDVTTRRWTAQKSLQLAEWIESTREGGSRDTWLWHTLIRADHDASEQTSNAPDR